MSNPYQNPIHPQPSQYNPGPATETNGLAIAGFVISMIGIFLCGLPSIIGLVVSLFALRKQPRGFAVAGVVVGVLGMLLMVAGGLMMFATYRTAQTIGTSVGVFGSQFQAAVDAGTIGENWKETGQLPSQEEGQGMLASDSDVFGNPFVYETDGESFTIRSAGPDGEIGTEDDITSGPFADAQSAIDEAPKPDEDGEFKFDFDFETP